MTDKPQASEGGGDWWKDTFRESMSVSVKKTVDAVKSIGQKVGTKKAIIKPKYPDCYPRRRFILLAMLWWGAAILHMNRSVFRIMVVPIAVENGWNPSTKGTLLSGYNWGALGSILPASFIVRKIGGKISLMIGILGYSLSSFLVPWAIASFPLCFANQIMGGLFAGFILPSIHHMISLWYPRMEKGRAVGIMYAGLNLGSVIALVLAPLVRNAFQWPIAFWGVAALGPIYLIFWIILASESPNLKNDKGFGRAFLCPVHQEEAAYIVRYRDVQRVNFTDAPLRHLFLEPAVIAIAVSAFSTGWGIYVSMDWAATYFASLAFDLTIAGVGSGAALFGMATLSLSAGSLADLMVNSRYFRLLTTRRIMNFVGFAGPGICHMLSAWFVVDPISKMIIFVAAISFSGFQRAGHEVNHLDIAPRFASIISSIALTSLTIGSIVGNEVTGNVLKNTSNNFSITFTIAGGVMFFAMLFFTFFSKVKLGNEKLTVAISKDDLESDSGGAEEVADDEANMD